MERQTELKDRIRKAGVTLADICVEKELPYGTTSQMLNGYIGLNPETKAKIEEFLEKRGKK